MKTLMGRNAYPEFLQRPAAKSRQISIMQQVVAQITWSHNVVLLGRIKNFEERIFYTAIFK